MVKKPDFITKNQVGVKVKSTRPYKWAPGIPSLAIQFDEIPKEKVKVYSQPEEDSYLSSESDLILMSENDDNILVEP